ncbi:hypothetical protein FKM82_021387 [Ascaphus truei]
MALTFISQNVKGFNSPQKRRIAFAEFKRRKTDVLFLQETHYCSRKNPGFIDKHFRKFYLASAKEKKKRGSHSTT